MGDGEERTEDGEEKFVMEGMIVRVEKGGVYCMGRIRNERCVGDMKEMRQYGMEEDQGNEMRAVRQRKTEPYEMRWWRDISLIRGGEGDDDDEKKMKWLRRMMQDCRKTQDEHVQLKGKVNE